MIDCRAFEIFSGLEALRSEIERLVLEIPQAFAEKNLHLGKPKPLTNNEGMFPRQIGFSYPIKAIRKNAADRQLLFSFDLWRPVVSSTWPNAKQALLTIAHAARFESGWEPGPLALGASGHIIETIEREKLTPHAGGRLIEWAENARSWPEKAWFFSVPLMALEDHQAFTREAVLPVVALLNEGIEPDAAMAGTSAINIRT